MNTWWNTAEPVMMTESGLKHTKNQRSSKNMKPKLRIAGRGPKRQRARLTPATKKGINNETKICTD